MASYVDPELYPREEEKLKICTACGAIIHEMSIPVHDMHHDRLDLFKDNQIKVNDEIAEFLKKWVNTSDSQDSPDRNATDSGN